MSPVEQQSFRSGPLEQVRAPEPELNGTAAVLPDRLEAKPEVDPAAVALVSAEQAVRLRAVPYGFCESRLLVAMLDPADLAGTDEIAVCSGHPVHRVPVAAE